MAPGWSRRRSRGSERVYYRHRASGKVCWERPVLHMHHHDAVEASQIDVSVGDAAWLQARSLFRSPAVGEVSDAPSGTPGYTPAASQPPSPREGACAGLPAAFLTAGWKRYESRSTGRSFYRNKINGRTRWTCPHCYPDLDDTAQGTGAIVLSNSNSSKLGTDSCLPRDVLSAKLDAAHTWAVREADFTRNMSAAAAVRHRTHKATWGSALVEEDVYIGLLIESKPPHLVAAVKGVTDVNFVQQGAPGYANEPVVVGDELLAVDGVRVNSGVGSIQDLLRGVARTPIELTLARKGCRSVTYTITAMRHRRDVELDSELIRHEDESLLSPVTSGANVEQTADSPPCENGAMACLQAEPGIVGLRISTSFVIEGISEKLRLAPDSQTLKRGDRIASIDGAEIGRLTLSAVHKLLKGPANTEITLGLLRGGRSFSARVIRHAGTSEKVKLTANQHRDPRRKAPDFSTKTSEMSQVYVV